MSSKSLGALLPGQFQSRTGTCSFNSVVFSHMFRLVTIIVIYVHIFPRNNSIASNGVDPSTGLCGQACLFWVVPRPFPHLCCPVPTFRAGLSQSYFWCHIGVRRDQSKVGLFLLPWWRSEVMGWGQAGEERGASGEEMY